MPIPSELPVAITVLTAAGCPRCAATVAHVERCAREQAAAGLAVAVTVTDVDAAPALVARFGLRSVPVVVVAG
ncbi:MAG TPA: thioredoxin family protein, partial [Polyangia bacterium]